ncbi:MAG TPA: tannase/feruloyl esterase family alpha/beta hydrolase [Bryobacteraceae bacterium]|nr:tannase/feruloyl esterase family alpha/beta hydrolase [Bryobacteraceae bacterium]
MTGRRLFLAALTLSAFSPAWAQQSCERLTSLAIRGLTVTSAVPVPPGSFKLPGGANAAVVQVPEFCRAAITIGKEVRMELWMPRRWNQKLVAVGNGGLAGSIGYAAMVKPLQQGYASSSTDTGHQGTSTTDGAWALGNYERIVNFADRGTHLMAEADKLILSAFYNAPPAHAYFNGCSQGGHEALVEAQRYPADFDGIVAGDPANNWTHHYIGGHLWNALAVDGDGYLPAAKVKILADAVNEQCDALDGVKDGVLNDPRRCRFNPATLLCKGSDTSQCLTTAQVTAVEKIWSGLRTPEGQVIYPGLVPGGEAGTGGWASYITGNAPGAGRHTALGAPFFRFFVFDDPNWDYKTFRFTAADGFDNDVDYTDAKLGALFNAVNPDLSGFTARGGKLIQYHGWSDPDITPLNSINYYESVVTAQGGDVHGLQNTVAFYRLFMVPGMWHCQGGPGATNFDMLESLDEWTTKGLAPERVIASHQSNGAVDRTRPLCPYPREAQWTGSGSTDDAANFVCALPRP